MRLIFCWEVGGFDGVALSVGVGCQTDSFVDPTVTGRLGASAHNVAHPAKNQRH